MFVSVYQLFMREVMYLKTAFILLFFVLEWFQLQALQFAVLLLFMKNTGNDVLKHNRLLLLSRITRANLSRLYLSFDLLHALWLNLWFLLSLAVFELIKGGNGYHGIISTWLLFNGLFFSSLLINTLLAHSDVHTLKSIILKKLMIATVFGVLFSLVYLLFRLPIHPYIQRTLLLILIGSWYAVVRRLNSVTYFQHIFQLQ